MMDYTADGPSSNHTFRATGRENATTVQNAMKVNFLITVHRIQSHWIFFLQPNINIDDDYPSGVDGFGLSVHMEDPPNPPPADDPVSNKPAVKA